MTFKSSFCATRRGFLRGGAAAIGVAATAGLSVTARAGTSESAVGVNMLLRPGAAQANLVSDPAYQTAVWAYNGIVPGPEIRVRQGQRLHFSQTKAEWPSGNWSLPTQPTPLDKLSNQESGHSQGIQG